MANTIFKHVQAKRPRSNTFDLSHGRKQSMDIGFLTPFFMMDCVPGDKVTMSSAQLIRFAPLIAPVMHQVKVYTHYYFVPNRILWDNWSSFITGGEDGDDTSVFPTININAADTETGGLADYLGLPEVPVSQNAGAVSALPFAAYQAIYNEYYRDQNLIAPINTDLVDGDNAAIKADLLGMRRRAFAQDYFTSALPWTQKGPEATIPLGTDANLFLDPTAVPGATPLLDTNGQPYDPAVIGNIQTQQAGMVVDNTGAGTSDPVFADVSQTHLVDLSNATAASINDLRRAFRLQEWLEKNARGGSRYTESILSHFGVQSPDARLQRPEYLGGGVSPVKFSEVLQTSPGGSDVQVMDTPQGNMAGHGINVGANAPVSCFAQEHGIIMGIMSVMPKASYQQGIHKSWTKFDKFDYYWPSFANLGEQPILNKEIYVNPVDGLDDEVFGYTPRYAEYKFIPDTVHGDFKGSLDFWHMGRIFSTRPALNQIFIQTSSVDYDRNFAVFGDGTTQFQKLWVQIFNQVKARRPMPVFGTPTI